MGLKYNPFTGTLDITGAGSSGGIPDASVVTYTPSTSGDWSPVPGYVSGALDQLASRGGGGTGDENFSYTHIADSIAVTIKENQQMLYAGDLVIDGDLYVYGEAREINDQIYNAMSTDYVLSGDAFLIPFNRVMFFKYLTIDGDLRIEGDLIEV